MEEIFYIQRFADAFLAHARNDKGVKVQVPIVEARGAVVEPKEGHPGYYLFFGMKREINMFGKHPLMFLCEFESPSPSLVMQRVTNDASRMRASVIYADRGNSRREPSGFYNVLWKLRSAERLPLKIVPAPSVSDHDYGRGLIRDWSDESAIERPMHNTTILFSQLKPMWDGATDLSQAQYYAFHAMRFLMAGFVKDPPMGIRGPARHLADVHDDISVPALQIHGSGHRSRLGAWT